MTTTVHVGCRMDVGIAIVGSKQVLHENTVFMSCQVEVEVGLQGPITLIRSVE